MKLTVGRLLATTSSDATAARRAVIVRDILSPLATGNQNFHKYGKMNGSNKD